MVSVCLPSDALSQHLPSYLGFLLPWTWGISWGSLCGLKGVKPPEAFGERSRGWPLRHAGDEGPHLGDDGGVSGWISSGGPRVRFLTRYDGKVSEPLVGRQGSRVPMRVARGTSSLLSSHGRGIWPRDVLKKVSRGFSQVEAGTLASLDLCR